MTGYVRAYKPEMKIKNYEEYRGIYCSLCRVLGKRYGIFARLILSYDFTFFAILLMSVQSEKVCFEKGHCLFNPAKKCNYCKKSEILEYTADVAILTAYCRILDNLHDEGFFRKTAMRLIQPVFYFYFKKAKRYAPEAAETVFSLMKNQREVEEKRSGNIDEAANPSAEALSFLLSQKAAGNERRILKRIGYLLGRWVYITDAYFDRNEDRKKGSYNPFNLDGKSENEIKAMLNITVGEMISAYELLQVRQFDDVIRNVLIDGLYFAIENNGGRKNEKSL